MVQLKEVDHGFGRETRMREARARTDSIEIVKVPRGDYTSTRRQMCLFKKEHTETPFKCPLSSSVTY